MNYRHSFHAGNHTEVFKHSVLVLLLQHLLKKPGWFTVIDSHAGAGIYDLTSDDATKTGEALDGIGRIIDGDVPTASAYLEFIRHLNPTDLRRYPGSPVIVRALLREDDRLIACELRKDDAALLRRTLRGDRRVAVHCRDGYAAIRAFLPPRGGRGLVFFDAPFERPDELERLAWALNTGIRKWPTGMFLAWYPIKDRSAAKRLRANYPSDSPPTLACEFLRDPVDGLRLAGSGLILCNPPWQFDRKLLALCKELLTAFDSQKGTYTLDWWIPEI